MSQDDQFHKYGYNHYLKAPKRPDSSMSNQRVVSIRSRLMRRLQSPVMATVALVFAAVFFVGVIILAYPKDDETERYIPIIKADLRPIKSLPLDNGGMKIPHSDSTLMANVSVMGVDVIGGDENIENLLDKSSTDLVSKEEAINLAMSQKPIVKIIHSSEEVDIKQVNDSMIMGSVVNSSGINKTKPDFEIKEPSAKDILQKIGAVSPEIANGEGDVFMKKVAVAAMVLKPDVMTVDMAKSIKGDNETIDFVRSVLNDNVDISSIEPASGGADSSGYFVQLASITNASRAGVEWSKMQKRYGVLSSAKYRVQEVLLPNGRFYRIQAGPMSKVEARKVCQELKKQNKPRGCLVVK